ncbi:MAG: hypothetical protein ACI9WU_000125 [Myxococcota bacterium]|jgi:hypothetical protein
MAPCLYLLPFAGPTEPLPSWVALGQSTALLTALSGLRPRIIVVEGEPGVTPLATILEEPPPPEECLLIAPRGDLREGPVVHFVLVDPSTHASVAEATYDVLEQSADLATWLGGFGDAIGGEFEPYAPRDAEALAVCAAAKSLLAALGQSVSPGLNPEPVAARLEARIGEPLVDLLIRELAMSGFPFDSLLDAGVERGADRTAFVLTRGMVRLEDDNVDGALADFRQVRSESEEISLGLAMAWFGIASCRERTGGLDLAMSALDKAVQSVPEGARMLATQLGPNVVPPTDAPDARVWLLAERARILVDAERFGDAEKVARQLMDLSTHPTQGLELLAAVQRASAVGVLDSDAPAAQAALYAYSATLERIFEIAPGPAEVQEGAEVAEFLEDEALFEAWLAKARTLSE